MIPPLPRAATESIRDPDWLGAACLATRHELALFLSTAVAYCRSPSAFSRGWAEGQIRTLNPLGFALQSAAIAGPYRHACSAALGLGTSDAPLWAEVLKALLPAVYSVYLALLCHLALRLGGGRRPFRSTLAISLYAGAPYLALGLLFYPLLAWFFARPGQAAAIVMGVVGLAITACYVVLWAHALAALHGVRARWPAVALVLGLAAYTLAWNVAGRAYPSLARWTSF